MHGPKISLKIYLSKVEVCTGQNIFEKISFKISKIFEIFERLKYASAKNIFEKYLGKVKVCTGQKYL